MVAKEDNPFLLGFGTFSGAVPVKLQVGSAVAVILERANGHSIPFHAEIDSSRGRFCVFSRCLSQFSLGKLQGFLEVKFSLKRQGKRTHTIHGMVYLPTFTIKINHPCS